MSILFILSPVTDSSGENKRWCWIMTNIRHNLIREMLWQTSRPWWGCQRSARPAWRAPWLGAGWADDPSSTGTPGRLASWAQARPARRWAGVTESETMSTVSVNSLKCLTCDHSSSTALSMMRWLSRAGFSLIIFIRCKEGTGSDSNHEPATQSSTESAGTQYPQRPVSYSHLRSAFNLPCPVHDDSFVGPHVALAPRLQHAQEVSLPVFLLWFLMLVVREDDPRLNNKHTH